ncbi:RNA polymerase factor sigma-54, partial [Rhizobium phaseoli]
MKSFTSLHQRQQQSLVITPQLIASIRLLQLAHTELNQFVEQEIEKNPFLDLASNDGGASGVSPTAADDPNISAREDHVDG